MQSSKSRWVLVSVILALGLFGAACGDDETDGGGGAGGAAGAGTGGTGGGGGTGGSGGGENGPCSLTAIQDPVCQTCIMDAVNGCPQAAITCLMAGEARTCIAENGCATIAIPPEVDFECVMTNCAQEVLDANSCMVGRCPAYAACFSG